MAALNGVQWPQPDGRVLQAELAETNKFTAHRAGSSGQAGAAGLAGSSRLFNLAQAQAAGQPQEAAARKPGLTRPSLARQKASAARGEAAPAAPVPAVEEEPPAKLLDDLFRKTEAAPALYWLPCDEPQIEENRVRRLRQEEEMRQEYVRAYERSRARYDSPPSRRRYYGRSPSRSRSPLPPRSGSRRRSYSRSPSSSRSRSVSRSPSPRRSVASPGRVSPRR